MPAEVKTAICRYVRCGGCFLVLGSWQPPDAWGCTLENRTGSLQIRYMHFGVYIGSDADFRQWPDETWQLLQEQIWSPAARQLTTKTSVANANTDYPVGGVAELSIPVRGLFVVVLGFAVVMGPVNLVVLSRKNRRIWLLWTVPTMAIVGSIAIVLYSAFAEGWENSDPHVAG